MADHTSISEHPFYNNIAGQYLIPLVFYNFSLELDGLQKDLAQQADIPPTIVDYLNLNRKIVAFGNSLLDSSATHFGVIRTTSTYQFFQDDYLMIFEGDSASALYNIQRDSLLRQNIVRWDPETVRRMEDLLKSVIQQHDDRMIRNRLTVE